MWFVHLETLGSHAPRTRLARSSVGRFWSLSYFEVSGFTCEINSAVMLDGGIDRKGRDYIQGHSIKSKKGCSRRDSLS